MLLFFSKSAKLLSCFEAQDYINIFGTEIFMNRFYVCLTIALLAADQNRFPNDYATVMAQYITQSLIYSSSQALTIVFFMWN